MSEYLENQSLYEKKVERLILAIYSIHSCCLAYISSQKSWGIWAFAFFLSGIAISWCLYLTQSRSFYFRAFITSAIMETGLIVYSIDSGDIYAVLPSAIAIVVLIGLYEIPKLINVCVYGSILLILYHVFIEHSVTASNVAEAMKLFMRLGAIFFAEYAVYYLTMNQKKSRRLQQETIEELKEAERSRDDFLANVSHELRTPINTICGMSEVVLKEELEPSIRENVFGIQNAGRNLMSVVSDILDFSELQTGTMEIVEETYNITSTINDIINMTMARKNEKNIELVVDCDASLPRGLVGDEQKIRRVIMNLVNNAIKYTQDGCVLIEIKYRKEDYGINLTVSVEDTGIGMKQESVEKLFVGFAQVDARKNRREGGIGLGLAISNAIVEAMGGFISVSSEWGKGTRIQFSIPQKVMDEQPIASVKNPDKLRVATYIDMEQFDLLKIRDAYSRNIMHMIVQLGVECRVCRNLAELKRRIEREHFSHIFISLVEYREDPAYFDALSEKNRIIIVIDRPDEKYVSNPHILRLYKPFFILPVTMLLNDASKVSGAQIGLNRHGRFIAPDAHILIVDDNEMNIRVAEGLLRPYKVRMTRALSGKEALEKIISRDYDFVFMDHMMPEMDGVETLQRIRQLPGTYYKNVPIIALTANAIGGMREMFLSSGFSDFIAKPIEVSVLERVLRRNLPPEKIQELGETEEISAAIPESGTSGSVSEDGNAEQIPDIRSRTAAKEATVSGEEFTVGELEVKQGLIFCGGRENYLEILKLQGEDEDTLLKLQNFYDKQDWKNYTILVHAVKSTMKSIGAQPLSEMAKNLEMAGKQLDIDYILAHHEELVQEYQRIQNMIREYFSSTKISESVENSVERPELPEEEFEQIIISFENAMYSLDVSQMTGDIRKLEQYQYHGGVLEEELKTVHKKVEMADYMSALDMLLRIREHLRKQ